MPSADPLLLPPALTMIGEALGIGLPSDLPTAGWGSWATQSVLGAVAVGAEGPAAAADPLLDAAPHLSPLMLWVMGSLLATGVGLWVWALRRWLRGEQVVPWQPRRPVPWQGIHVVIILFAYITLMSSVPLLLVNLSDLEAPAPGDAVRHTQHPIAEILLRSDGLLARVVCIAAAAITAPVCEEFVFRLVLQGWLEARERRLRRRWRWARWPTGLMSVIFVAALFGGIHARGAVQPRPLDYLMVSMAGSAVANVLTVLFGLAILVVDVRATRADLGWDRSRFAPDALVGLLALPAIGVIVYPLQLLLTRLLPSDVPADPISLVFLGAMLGALYLRTHRLIAPIVLHMALNTTSILMVLST